MLSLAGSGLDPAWRGQVRLGRNHLLILKSGEMTKMTMSCELQHEIKNSQQPRNHIVWFLLRRLQLLDGKLIVSV